jgi:type II secretory pathway component PulF
MNDRTARRLSWAITLTCCAYVAWLTYVFATRIPAFAQLFVGLGGPLPATTRFVLAASRGVTPYLVGGALILLLVIKEYLLASRFVRVATTVLVFMAVAEYATFAAEAMLKPLYMVIQKIG